jgi:hypothetical protein
LNVDEVEGTVDAGEAAEVETAESTAQALSRELLMNKLASTTANAQYFLDNMAFRSLSHLR